MAKKKTRRGTTRKKARRGTTRKKTRRSKARGRPRGSTKKTTRRKLTRKKAGRRGRPRTLSTLSSEQLRVEIDRRLDDLEQRRRELQGELDELEQELEVLGGAAAQVGGGPAPRRKPGRPRKNAATRGRTTRRTTKKKTRRRGRGGQANLADALLNVLQGKEMGIKEMTDAVKRSGYRTKSSNFTAVVSQTLGRHSDLFRKTGRGRYTAA